MRKSDLIKNILNKYNYQQEDISKIINIIFNEFYRALTKGDKIEIRRFGSFSVRQRFIKHSDTDRNIVYFRMGKELKNSINESAMNKSDR